jgi:hypothetical protein
VMPNFGFQPGVLDYWMLLSDWRNGTFAILLTLAVLLIGYAIATRDKVLAPDVPGAVEGIDERAQFSSIPSEERPPAPTGADKA